MINKKGFEFSFNWIFALIVGAAILFLALYAAIQLIGTQRTVQDTQLGKKLGIILNPIETSLETAKYSAISLPAETRIFNYCDDSGNFGLQRIATSTSSGIGEQWQEQGGKSAFSNKYIFSEKMIEGDNFLVFSKPFEMPFKIADIIYLWPDNEKFCLVNPPSEIEEEVVNLQLKNINVSSTKCSGSINVCFSNTDCDISVFLDESSEIRGSIKKKFSDRVYFNSPALLYAGIFSDKDIYECQVKRLMKRASELSWLYYAKTNFLASKGCPSNLEFDLALYANQTFYLNNSLELMALSLNSEELKRRNNELICDLF